MSQSTVSQIRAPKAATVVEKKIKAHGEQYTAIAHIQILAVIDRSRQDSRALSSGILLNQLITRVDANLNGHVQYIAERQL